MVKLDGLTNSQAEFMRKSKERILIEDLLITDIADKGQALGKVENQVIFVDRAIPGDIVDVSVVKRRKNYMEGKVVQRKSPSVHRVDPFCSHFGICGGCKWQDMDYHQQLFFKEKQVRDAMIRIARLLEPEISPIIPAPETTYYRNKLEFTFSDKRWLPKEELDNKEIKADYGLGFHIPGRFDKILDISHCYLQQNPSNDIRLAVKSFTVTNEYTYFDPVSQIGFLRNMIIRTSGTGELMVIIVFHFNDEEKINALMNHLKITFPQITSLLYVINAKKNDIVSDLSFQLFAGQDFITEKMGNLVFKVGPKSFFQTNSKQAAKLYEIAGNFAGISAEDIVYDLYTGTGTIANYVAHMAKKVIGVEYIEEAIENAKENSQMNNIKNTAFFAGDMKSVLSDDFFNKHGFPDIIITDPPRAGMELPVVERIRDSGAKTIVYVSCNPATQARDMLLLADRYELKKCQPVDMFPHTHHVENVVLLQLRKPV